MNKIKACLLIHGFTDSPQTMEGLAKALSKEGFYVVNMCLAGHGKDRETLLKSTAKQWIESARKEFFAHKDEYDIIPIGFSMGGLIGAILASENSVSKIVFINTPIYVWGMRKYVARRTHQGVRGSSLKLKFEFLKVLKKSKRLLGKISAPALVLQSKDDLTVRPHSAEYIKNEIKLASMSYIQGGRHLVLYSDYAKEVTDKIIDFLKI